MGQEWEGSESLDHLEASFTSPALSSSSCPHPQDSFFQDPGGSSHCSKHRICAGTLCLWPPRHMTLLLSSYLLDYLTHTASFSYPLPPSLGASRALTTLRCFSQNLSLSCVSQSWHTQSLWGDTIKPIIPRLWPSLHLIFHRSNSPCRKPNSFPPL